MALKVGAGESQPPTWPLPGQDTPQRRRPLRRLAVRALWSLVALALLTSLTLGYSYWRLSQTVTSYTGAHFNQGENAVWLEHTWAGSQHSEVEYDTLAMQLQQERIGYVFAHVGPLDSAGDIPASVAPLAATFVNALHMRLPQVKVLAWIGQLEAASGQPADQVVNLDDSKVRERIAQTSARFVRQEGFDGVHYDIEPIRNNNPRFLDLLDETRTLLPPSAILSVSAQKWAPNAHVADLFYNAGRAGEWWTSYYYTAVASHVDQLVVMTYDTAMPTASLYQVFVKEETEHILQSARSAPHPPQVLMGVPTYTGDTTWFHASAENMRSGLSGVIAGLNSDRDTRPFVGVAIYRFGVTTDASWSTYNQLWLGR